MEKVERRGEINFGEVKDLKSGVGWRDRLWKRVREPWCVNSSILFVRLVLKGRSYSIASGSLRRIIKNEIRRGELLNREEEAENRENILDNSDGDETRG